MHGKYSSILTGTRRGFHSSLRFWLLFTTALTHFLYLRIQPTVIFIFQSSLLISAPDFESKMESETHTESANKSGPHGLGNWTDSFEAGRRIFFFLSWSSRDLYFSVFHVQSSVFVVNINCYLLFGLWIQETPMTALCARLRKRCSFQSWWGNGLRRKSVSLKLQHLHLAARPALSPWLIIAGKRMMS